MRIIHLLSLYWPFKRADVWEAGRWKGRRKEGWKGRKKGSNLRLRLKEGLVCESRKSRKWNKVSISSTLYERVFHTNVVSAAFSSCMYVTCTWKKLPKQHSYEKSVQKMLMKLTLGEWFLSKSAALSNPFVPNGFINTCKIWHFLTKYSDSIHTFSLKRNVSIRWFVDLSERYTLLG